MNDVPSAVVYYSNARSRKKVSICITCSEDWAYWCIKTLIETWHGAANGEDVLNELFCTRFISSLFVMEFEQMALA